MASSDFNNPYSNAIKTASFQNTSTGQITTNIPANNILSAVAANWGGARCFIERVTATGMATIFVIDNNGAAWTDTRIAITVHYIT